MALSSVGAAPARALSDTEAFYKGLEGLSAADREKTLVEGAKKEGTVVWYTTDGPTPTQVVIKAFSQKYPFVKAGFIRGKSQDILDRITTEARAGRNLFDVAKTSTETFDMYPVADVFAAYVSPAKTAIPENMRAERWSSVFTFVRAMGYNSRLLKESDLPKTWEDLLDPRWKNKILFDPSSLPEMMTLYTRWGRERAIDFVGKLGASGNLQIRNGRTTITQMLAAGEAPIGMTVYPYDVEALKSKGAPVDWALIDPSPGLLQPLSIARNAPHPYAAALLYDYLLSTDGQKVYAQMNRTPANPAVETSNPRERAAAKDPRIVFDTSGGRGSGTEEMLKVLDEKILKKKPKG
ncbi:MAG TPA: extracellular solute-binding protein [Alphaproteobacteria bacterium]|nr:extracellular solute-binding protein [Alphaproteobacteria bacterium]